MTPSLGHTIHQLWLNCINWTYYRVWHFYVYRFSWSICKEDFNPTPRPVPLWTCMSSCVSIDHSLMNLSFSGIFSIHRYLKESITTIRKGQGNPIRMPMICNPQRGLPSRGNSWSRGGDSLVPSGVYDWLFFSHAFIKVSGATARWPFTDSAVPSSLLLRSAGLQPADLLLILLFLPHYYC